MAPFLPVLAVIVLQTGTSSYPSGSPPSPSAGNSVTATRARAAPLIDGKDTDEVWRLAQAITAFRQFRPVEDTTPSMPTEAKVAYDDHNFYVFIRAFDPAPDSIQKLLARRDIRVCCDQLKIIIDSYHDRRTGYEFAVNPAGVKRDYAVYDDGNEDGAWDGVWEVGTQVDSLGWTAEFRIPLSQLRYAHRPGNTFGFGIWRDVDRRGQERISWPLYRVTRTGFISQLGEITGLDGLAAPKRLELAPYVVTKNVPMPGFEREQQSTAGADIKYGLTSNITVDATVNPDFGQVEADPAVVNLTAFETFLHERRPFFMEGVGIFQFGVNCNIVNCRGEVLFYSRRIGREPQLLGAYGEPGSPQASTILGAAKITGRLPGGLTIGALEAVTQRERGFQNATIEPLTNYSALRLQQDFRKGESGIGVMLTGVNRDLDTLTEGVLRSTAYVGAIDFRHRFLGKRYEISGSLGYSLVKGSPGAIARTQQSIVHNYQRPDDDVQLNPASTRLSGGSQELVFGKRSGFIRFETSYMRRSPGFEINDLGILFRADQQGWNTWGSMNFQKPTKLFTQGFWNFNWWQFWTVGDGLPTDRAANTNAHFQLKNRWWVHYGATIGNLGEIYCDRCARGGPAVRRDQFISPWWGIEGDQRLPVIPYLFFSYVTADGGRTTAFNVNPSVDLRVSSRFRGSISFDYTNNFDNLQDISPHTDSTLTTHYLFAHLEQQTMAMSFRVDYTATTNLTVQVYAQPFVSRGEFSGVREVSATPRAENYDARFQPYAGVAPFEFNQKFFNSNFVVRWEYRPGSTIFLVWNQGRDDFEDVMGSRGFRKDFGRLFNAYPRNTFLIKASYWLTPLTR